MPTLPARAWHGGADLTSLSIDAAAMADADCVAILTEPQRLDYDIARRSAPLIVDTRNAIKERHPARVPAWRPHCRRGC